MQSQMGCCVVFDFGQSTEHSRSMYSSVFTCCSLNQSSLLKLLENFKVNLFCAIEYRGILCVFYCLQRINVMLRMI